MRKPMDASLRGGEVLPFSRVGQAITPSISHTSQQHIATNLRAMYDDLVQQPLPDRFVELLAELDQKKEQQER
jgi:hypothetical protein